MTVEEFSKLPFLMRRSQVINTLGVSPAYLSKLTRTNQLGVVRTSGGQIKYLKVDVARLAGITINLNKVEL